MTHVHDLAITLRHFDYGETSQVLILFGRASGKIRLIAKGVKRSTRTRFATGIDLLEMGELVFSFRPERQAAMGTLVEWKQTTIYSGLRTDPNKLFGAQYAAEITARLTEDHDPHPVLFDAMENALRSLENAPLPLIEIVRYQVSLLTEIGLFPQLDACSECKKNWYRSNGWQFSSHNGGLVCRDCEGMLVEKRRLHDGAVELLRRIRDRDAEDSTDSTVSHVWEGCFDVLDYHLAHLMGRPASLAEYVLPQARRRVLGRAPKDVPANPPERPR